MALTFTMDAGMPIRIGKRRFATGTVAFDATYPTNGELFAVVDFGMPQELEAVMFVGGLSAVQRIMWDKANLKLKVYTEAGGVSAEHTNGTDPGIAAARFLAIGY